MTLVNEMFLWFYEIKHVCAVLSALLLHGEPEYRAVLSSSFKTLRGEFV